MAIIKRSNREAGFAPPFRRRLLQIACAALWIMTGLSLPVKAHDPGLSMAEFKVEAQTIQLKLTFARRDIELFVPLDSNRDGQLSDAELTQAQIPLKQLATELVELVIADQIQPGRVKAVARDPSDAVVLSLAFPRTDGNQFQFSAPKLPDMPLGHRQFVTVWQHGKPIRSEILSAARNRIMIPLDPVPGWQQCLRFVGEGIWHIWIGFDHILFLVAMLLPAALTFVNGAWRPRETWRTTLVQVVKIVTAFTLAHSITLSLAVFDLVRLDAVWVESVIAASVIFAAINNVRPLIRGELWLMSFGFGLIHGLGFASVLADLGLPAAAKGLALIGFNIGVETGQLAIIAILLPGIFMLRQRRLYRTRILQSASIVIAVIATFWLIERSTGFNGVAALLSSA